MTRVQIDKRFFTAAFWLNDDIPERPKKSYSRHPTTLSLVGHTSNSTHSPKSLVAIMTKTKTETKTYKVCPVLQSLKQLIKMVGWRCQAGHINWSQTGCSCSKVPLVEARTHHPALAGAATAYKGWQGGRQARTSRDWVRIGAMMWGTRQVS